MSDDLNASQPAATDSGDDATSRRDLDLIFERWMSIAAAGWQGFVFHDRRGVVIVNVTCGDVRLEYFIGSPCPCHEELVGTYDPAECVVIAVVREDSAHIYPVIGLPAPPDVVVSRPWELLGVPTH